jgi:hypothetical protein
VRRLYDRQGFKLTRWLECERDVGVVVLASS